MNSQALSTGLVALAIAGSVVAGPVTIDVTGVRRVTPLQAQGVINGPAKAGATAVNVPITDWFNKTDLQWYATVSVGTPPQNLTVVLDTGSADLLLPRSTCTTCGTHKKFDSTKSSTFSSSPGNQEPLSFSTGADTIPFTRPEGANGHVVTDTVSIGGLTSPKQEFLLCDTYAAALDGMPIDGILGISLPNTSFTGVRGAFPLYWNLYYSGQLPSPVFSFYMKPGSAYGGQITLGGIDSTKYTGAIKYINLNQESAEESQYILDQPSVYINDALFRSSSGAAYPSGISILDTGTAFIQTPDVASTKSLYAQISSQIKEIDPAGAWGAPCDVLDRVAPQLSFTVGTGSQKFNLTIPKTYFNLGEYPGQPGICQALFNSPMGSGSAGSRPMWIIGSPVLKAYYTVWDAVNLKVGFAKPVA